LKKLLLLFAALSLSGSVLSQSTTTTAKLFPIPSPIKTWQDQFIESRHAYSLYNDTAQVQNISLCFDIVVYYRGRLKNDPENKHDPVIKNVRECESHILSPNETQSGIKNLSIRSKYADGSYHVLAQTETTGGTYSIAKDLNGFWVDLSLKK
jgi:hypothetical protein